MMPTLPPDDRMKLARILGMLGSDHDGERAAAGKLATDLIRRHGLQWSDVLDPPDIKPKAKTCQERAAWALQHGMECLKAKERSFLLNVVKARLPISAKQEEWLDALESRVQGWVAGGEE